MNFLPAETLEKHTAKALGVTARPGTMVGIRPDNFRTIATAKALVSAKLEVFKNLYA